MKIKTSNLFTILIICFIILCSACKDFIEPSLSHRNLQPEAPADNFKTTNYTVKFWWDEMEDALYYRLQIASPGFDSVKELIIDTLVKVNNFKISIEPGVYQYRIRAENGSSNSEFSSPRNFTVISSTLSDQTVELISPINNSLTNQSSILFRWAALYGADKYRVQIDTSNFVNNTGSVTDQLIPAQQLTFKLPNDRNFQWRVRGENSNENSKWSVINAVTLDATPPQAVTLTSPENNATVSKPVVLQWQPVKGASGYKLYVYKNNTISLYNDSFPLSVKSTSYSINIGSSGEHIYWEVTAVDAIGNESDFKDLRIFLVQ
jgi:hypothetical protein